MVRGAETQCCFSDKRLIIYVMQSNTATKQEARPDSFTELAKSVSVV